MRRRSTVLIVLLAMAMLLGSNTGVQARGLDLSQLVVPPDAIGDDWSIASQATEPTLFRGGFNPPAISGYVVTYAQSEQLSARIALYAFPDHAGALASLGDPSYYWGRGNTTLVPLDGLGDAQSYRAYGVGRGPNSGIGFVDGPVVVYVQAEDEAASNTSGVETICDTLAAAQDARLQAAR